jgi:hypothetical protein
MIIIWSWADNASADLRLDFNQEAQMKIEGYPKDLLLRYDSGIKQLNDARKYLEKAIKTHSATHQIQIFLHRNHGFEPSFFNSVKRPDNCILNFNIFGAGDPIYLLVPSSPYGLLTIGGNMHATINSIPYSSTVQKEGEIMVKKPHFNFVWNYYQHFIKNKTALLMEDFVRIFYPEISTPGWKTDENIVSNWEHRALDLAQKFKNINKTTGFTTVLNDSETDKVQSSFYSEDIAKIAQKLGNSLQDFVKARKKAPLTHERLILLRESFIGLLNAMPEKAYV